jgi:hypothetical protein
MAKQQRYVAIRPCYYGPKGYHTYFNPGDYLPEGWEPGKHFVPEHDFVGEADPVATGPGDDSRSTKKILFDLKAVHKIDLPSDTPRKVAYTEWIRAEEDAAPVVIEPVEGVTEVDPLGTLKFADLTDKDIDAVLAKDIIASMQFRFGMDVKHAGKSKKQLVELGAELESKQTGARAP